MTPGLTIEQTTDRRILRRWMLSPDVVQGSLTGLPSTAAEVEQAFERNVSDPKHVFWLVRWEKEERGIVMMRPIQGGWEPHLSLKTQRPHTREVMRELFRRVAPTTILFYYCVLHTRMERLADDLGFGPPRMDLNDPKTTAPWCIRTLRVAGGTGRN